MILSLEFSDANPWSVRELSERFGMSNVPVYGALKRLEQEGVITVLPRRGIVVNRLSYAKYREARLVREGLEVQAARVVAISGTEAMFDELTRMAQDVVDLVKRDEFQAAVIADRKLHKQLVDFAGCEMLSERFEQLAVICLLADDPNAGSDAVEGHSHTIMVEALKTRDPDIADKAVRAHIASYASKKGKSGKRSPAADVSGASSVIE